MEHNGIARSPELGLGSIINVDEEKAPLEHGRWQNVIETSSVYATVEKLEEDLKKLQQRIEQNERMLQLVRHPDSCTEKDGTICKHLPDNVAGKVNKDLVDELKEDLEELRQRMEQNKRRLGLGWHPDYSALDKDGTTHKYFSDVAGMVSKDLVEKLNSGRHDPELEAKLDELMAIFCMHEGPFEDFERANFKEYITKSFQAREHSAYIRNGRHLLDRHMTISKCFVAILGSILFAHWAGFAQLRSWSPSVIAFNLVSLVYVLLTLWSSLKLYQHDQSKPVGLSAGFSFNMQLPPSLMDHPEGRKYMEEAAKSLEVPLKTLKLPD